MARRALGLPRVCVYVWSPLVQHLHCCLFYGWWCTLVCVCIHSKHSIRSLCKICVHVFCDDMPLLHCVLLAYVPAALCARLALCVSVCCCVAPLMCSVCTISCVGGLRDEDQYLLRHSSPALEQDSPTATCWHTWTARTEKSCSTPSNAWRMRTGEGTARGMFTLEAEICKLCSTNLNSKNN